MKEYVISILLIATMITLVAVAAGSIIYIKARYGVDSLTFQLSRVGILWGVAIGLLLLVGTLCACVTDWTLTGLSDLFAWFVAHNPGTALFGYLMKFLKWGYNEHPFVASALLYGAAAIPLAFLYKRQACTLTAAILVALIHAALNAYIWLGATWWFLIQVVVVIVMGVCWHSEGIFDNQYTWKERRKMRLEAQRKTMAATHVDAPDSDPGPDEPSPSTPDHHRPVEVLSAMISDCAKTLADQ